MAKFFKNRFFWAFLACLASGLRRFWACFGAVLGLFWSRFSSPKSAKNAQKIMKIFKSRFFFDPDARPGGWRDLSQGGRPDAGPHHSVECARSPKSGSPGSFLPIFFAGGVKDALFRRPSGPNPPPPPRRGARPVKSTSYGTPVPRCRGT